MKRLLTIALLGFLALVASSSAAQSSFPTLISSSGLFSEGELATLQRDADLAQRSGVPIMFVVVRGDGTSAGSAQSYAETYRADRGVETSAGADDGIVFLVHWVPDAPEKSVVVYSAGSHAFQTTGLNDESIQRYITGFVEPRLHDGMLFEANVFLMRLTRATSLYDPPPVRAITGVALGVQRALIAIAPLAALGTMALTWRTSRPAKRQRWKLIALSFAVVIAVAMFSVWTHSRIGIASVLVMLVSLAIWCLWVTRNRDNAPIPWRQIAPDIVIALLLIGTSFSINMQQVELTPGDRDETRWINRAYYAADLADPFGPTWQDYIITVGQPPLGSIAIGTGMALQGQDLRAAGVWDYQYDKKWFEATGGYPTQDALHAARRTNAAIGALSTGAAYVLGRLLTNRIGGIAAGVFLAWHPLHIVLSTQALSDQTFALLLLLALIAAWKFAEKPTWARAIVFGILLGLGGATKLTPLLLAPPLVVFGIVRLWFDRSETGRRAGWMLISQPFIAFAAFVAIYPWLWPNPIERTWRLFSFRSGEMDAQTSAWPNALTEGPLDALSRFGYKLTYTHSTSQKALQHLYDWAGIDRIAVGIDVVLAAAGVVILLWIVAQSGLWSPHALVGCLLLGELALLAIGMKADFYRYHLPVVMIVSAGVAVSVGTAWNAILHLVRQRHEAASPSIQAEVATQ